MKKIFSLLALALLTIPFLAFAEGSFSISPSKTTSGSWLVYSIKPGDTLKDEFLVKNLSDAILTVSIYPSDAEDLAPGQSKDVFALKSKDAAKTGVAKWVTLAQSTVTLQPKSEQAVGLNIAVPADTPEKEYRGGILAELAPQQQAGGKNSVAISTRVGLRLYATVSKAAVTSTPVVVAPATEAASNFLTTPAGIALGVILLIVVIFLVREMLTGGSKPKKK